VYRIKASDELDKKRQYSECGELGDTTKYCEALQLVKGVDSHPQKMQLQKEIHSSK
jgi:hypothetical protein